MGKIEKQLRKIPQKERNRILDIMDQILDRDFSALNRKQLTGYRSLFRVRVGNYRIIYFDDGQQIEFEGIRIKNEHTYDNL